MRSQLSAKWDVIVSVFFTGCVFAWASHNIWDKVTAELITFFGIQAAAVLPAMIFTAGFLKSEGVSLEEARKYRIALRSQMVFWSVVLGLDFSAALSVITGKIFSWTLVFTTPNHLTWLVKIIGNQIDASIVFACITTFLSSLAVLRLIPIVKGIMSLLELHGEITENAIKLRNSKVAEEILKAATTPINKPENFGKISKSH